MNYVKTLEHLEHVTLPNDYQSRPGPFLAAMQARHGPVFASTTLWGDDILHLVGPEANRLVLVTRAHMFGHRAGWDVTESAVEVFGPGLVFLDGDEHARDRRLLSPSFAPKQVEAQLPLIHEIVDNCLNLWPVGGSIDVYEEAHRITFEVAARVILGIREPEKIQQLRAVFLELLSLAVAAVGNPGHERGPRWQEMRTAELRDQLRDIMSAELVRLETCPATDALGALAAAHAQSVFTEDQVLAHINVLLLAAHATTTGLAAWLLHLLASHPEYAERARAEQDAIIRPGAIADRDQLHRLEVLDRALLEAERLYPPIANLPRVLLDDVEFSNQLLPRGCLAFLSIAGCHHLSAVFSEPEAFDPDRFAAPRQEHRRTPFSLVGFSAGPRRCLGVELARLQVKVIASTALRRFEMQPVSERAVVQLYHPIGTPLAGIPLEVRERT